MCFLAFKSDREDDSATTNEDIEKCNKEWFIIDTLEHAKDDELRAVIKRCKMDLWHKNNWQKRQREKKRAMQSKTDKLRNYLRKWDEEHLFEFILPLYMNQKLRETKVKEYIQFMGAMRDKDFWKARRSQDKEELAMDLHKHLLSQYSMSLAHGKVMEHGCFCWEMFYERELGRTFGKTFLPLDVNKFDCNGSLFEKNRTSTSRNAQRKISDRMILITFQLVKQ